MRIVFLKIRYMRYYKGLNSFDFPAEPGKGGEIWNFMPRMLGETEVCYGNFTTKDRNGYQSHEPQHNLFHIERIDPEKQNAVDDTLEHVLVVWCAVHPDTKKTCIVGWYQDAKVFKKYQWYSFMDGSKTEDWEYNSIARMENCFLLPPDERALKKWHIRPSNEKGFDFGQSFVHYAMEDAPLYAADIAKQIQDYTRDHADENYIHMTKETEEERRAKGGGPAQYWG